MEIDDLKTAWLELDNKLQRSEKLKAETIKEMYRTKADKSISKILNYDIFSIVICLLVLPLIIWFIGTREMKNFWFAATMIYWGVFDIVGIIYSVLKVCQLLKFDLTKSISHNIKIIHRYNIQIKKEKPIYAVFAVIGIIPIVAVYIQKALLWQWVFLCCMLIIGLITSIWQYKRIYDTNIKSIMNSLDELKEIEE
jgi:hypothetical protein